MKTLRIYLSIAAVLFAFSACAQKAEVFATKKGAIDGYDPVAYFKQHKAVKGNHTYSEQWNGATWYFSSKENLDAFTQDPEKYAPQFGGYCAYAVANGYTAKSEGDAWKIVEGKLYLNYNLKVKEQWQEKQTEYIKSARQNWPKVLKK
ncbi:YHS domain-containing (seleno)protein [Rapidithrix thailandica]|uniref:YHS domain-containing (Seleno)protein n=1 Tax=Rapidithrix thailandica TaxID=413964 RepID=A0AAW9RTM8_9BACT